MLDSTLSSAASWHIMLPAEAPAMPISDAQRHQTDSCVRMQASPPGMPQVACY